MAEARKLVPVGPRRNYATPRPTPVEKAIAVASDPVGVLCDTLEGFAVELHKLAAQLTKEQREDLADKFLVLALELRQPGMTPAPKRAKRELVEAN
jgi:hypothetical protein